ncbi:MAG: hypothetical protein S4CHLAM81_09180 [Chlamydiales bacterium]|nr:hypothetical protein [Chlamydiales bacterium]MCH9635697.1 hypothetical protein [Chlamydiales bacterium]MCH9704494.1 hypothetical protein [Chlamydiota bacterium]
MDIRITSTAGKVFAGYGAAVLLAVSAVAITSLFRPTFATNIFKTRQIGLITAATSAVLGTALTALVACSLTNRRLLVKDLGDLRKSKEADTVPELSVLDSVSEGLITEVMREQAPAVVTEARQADQAAILDAEEESLENAPLVPGNTNLAELANARQARKKKPAPVTREPSSEPLQKVATSVDNTDMKALAEARRMRRRPKTAPSDQLPARARPAIPIARRPTVSMTQEQIEKVTIPTDKRDSLQIVPPTLAPDALIARVREELPALAMPTSPTNRPYAELKRQRENFEKALDEALQRKLEVCYSRNLLQSLQTYQEVQVKAFNEAMFEIVKGHARLLIKAPELFAKERTLPRTGFQAREMLQRFIETAVGAAGVNGYTLTSSVEEHGVWFHEITGVNSWAGTIEVCRQFDICMKADGTIHEKAAALKQIVEKLGDAYDAIAKAKVDEMITWQQKQVDQKLVLTPFSWIEQGAAPAAVTIANSIRTINERLERVVPDFQIEGINEIPQQFRTRLFSGEGDTAEQIQNGTGELTQEIALWQAEQLQRQDQEEADHALAERLADQLHRDPAMQARINRAVAMGAEREFLQGLDGEVLEAALAQFQI